MRSPRSIPSLRVVISDLRIAKESSPEAPILTIRTVETYPLFPVLGNARAGGTNSARGRNSRRGRA